MSAFIVDDVHIDAMITAALFLSERDSFTFYVVDETAEYGLRAETVTTGNADRFGAMLVAANRASVNARYSEDDLETIYTFRPLRFALAAGIDPVVILRAVNCYVYQSCEHEGWKASEAKAFCDALTGAAIRVLPGYDAGPWEITDRSAFVPALKMT